MVALPAEKVVKPGKMELPVSFAISTEPSCKVADRRVRTDPIARRAG